MQSVDDAVTRAIVASRTFAVVERLRLLVVAAASGSRVIGACGRVRAWWALLPWNERRVQAGVLLMAAVAVHVALLLAAGAYSSWMVFIVPSTVALIAAAALATGSSKAHGPT